MDTQQPLTSSVATQDDNRDVYNDHDAPSTKQPSLVPKGITIGLAVFALVLSVAGYGFRIIAGDNIDVVMRHALIVVPAFIIGIPLLFWLGSKAFNFFNGTHIEGRNAISLGYLTACISMLWLMGTYS